MFALVNFILLFLIILILIGFTFVVVKKNQKHNNYLKKITNVFYQIRYGNLNTSLTGAKTKLEQELENVINSSIESISDRDNMIQEHIEREREMAVLKSDFIAALTHDLKVPVIAHDKTFDLLLDNKFGELTPEQNEAIKNLKTSNMDLKYLIEALLETYKLEQTKLVEDVTYGVNVPLFIHEVISMIEPIAIAHNKKIDLIVSTTDDFTADIDKFLIKRVLQNLILNGLNHSVNSDFIEVTLKAKGENFQIDIKDSGSGIDEEEIKKIFDKYYSGSNGLTRSGVGLGLYLSNKIVKACGGKIKVKSDMGKNTVFSIILPKYKNNPQEWRLFWNFNLS